MPRCKRSPNQRNSILSLIDRIRFDQEAPPPRLFPSQFFNRTHKQNSKSFTMGKRSRSCVDMYNRRHCLGTNPSIHLYISLYRSRCNAIIQKRTSIDHVFRRRRRYPVMIYIFQHFPLRDTIPCCRSGLFFLLLLFLSLRSCIHIPIICCVGGQVCKGSF